MNYFMYDGFRSDTAGLLVESRHTLGLPERDVEKIHVPGRHGDVLIDHGSYQNVRVSYDCAARDNAALELLKQALTAGVGYRLLTDSFSPWQRMALCASALDIEELLLQRAFRFTITFYCKPQRWHDRAAVVTRSGAGSLTLNRPVGATASTPRIEIIGSGTVTLGLEGQTITLAGLVTPPMTSGEYQWPSAVIDSEAMVCYRTSGAGVRTNIDIPQWPQFWQLVHTVSATGGVTSIKIYPRWWCV